MIYTTITDLYREYSERCGGDTPARTQDELREEFRRRGNGRYEDADCEAFLDAIFADGWADKKMSWGDFWNNRDVVEIFLVGVGCPAGWTITHNTDTDDDEEYCDLYEVVRDGLGGTDALEYDVAEDGHSTDPNQHTGHELFGALMGTVSDDGKTWKWDGEGRAFSAQGNDYHRIQLTAPAAESQSTITPSRTRIAT